MAELSYTSEKTKCNSQKFHLTFLVEMFVPTLGTLGTLLLHWSCWMLGSSEVLEISQEVSEETAMSYCSCWAFIHTFCN